MTLRQAGGSVEGNYTYDEGHVAGQVAGDLFTGRWDEAPTRMGPTDAGPFELTLQAGGKSFTGRWRHDGDTAWWPDPWNGTCTGGECLQNGTPPPTTCPPQGRSAAVAAQTPEPCHVVSRLEKAYARYALSHWGAYYYM